MPHTEAIVQRGDSHVPPQSGAQVAVIKHRVAVLCDANLHTQATVPVLIRAGVNIVAVAIAEKRVSIKRIQRALKRGGAWSAASRKIAMIACRTLYGRHDKKAYDSLYNRAEIELEINRSCVSVRRCTEYTEPEMLEWLRSVTPDVIVVHSGVMVPAVVRNLALTGIVIGGHPGITQSFRGGSSPFRALYQGRRHDVGWTVFHVGKGVDTGDIISQGLLQLRSEDSFNSIEWRAMLCIAEEQGRVLSSFDKGQEIPRHPYGPVNPDTLYWHPTLSELGRFLLKRREESAS